MQGLDPHRVVYAGSLSKSLASGLRIGWIVLPPALLEPVLRGVGAAGSASIVHDLIYGGCTLQVRPPGISKWSGVLAFCAERGIDPGRVLAVGDGANDLELLEAAAVACVVDTATPAVLARAHHVLGPPSDGGWAGVLDLIGQARPA